MHGCCGSGSMVIWQEAVAICASRGRGSLTNVYDPCDPPEMSACVPGRLLGAAGFIAAAAVGAWLVYLGGVGAKAATTAVAYSDVVGVDGTVGAGEADRQPGAVTGGASADGETAQQAGEPGGAGTAAAAGGPDGVVARGIADSVSEQWAQEVGQATGIPARAMLAYGGAVLAMRAEAPECALGWNTMAAIGGIESGHGSHDGAALDVDGHVTPHILGPVLDGVSTAAVRDTDDGALDGDASWDRAVGPLQFIPSTWEAWGADGNGDGIADPHQLDDAALAAARYLCHSGSMADAAGWRAAVFSYNHSDEYVTTVAAWANEYAARATAAG